MMIVMMVDGDGGDGDDDCDDDGGGDDADHDHDYGICRDDDHGNVKTREGRVGRPKREKETI